jgi:CRP/FNR family transcriptional regulator, cyclic AMP receptor protein
MQALESLLREAPVFRGLADEQLALVAGCGSNVHIAEDAVLFREGDPADVFYLIRDGVVALETFALARGAITIETIETGEVVGWSWLFPPYRWHFDARALTPLRATVFDGACLRGKCEADPALGFELMSRFAQVLIERLQWTRLRLLDVYGDDRPR